MELKLIATYCDLLVKQIKLWRDKIQVCLNWNRARGKLSKISAEFRYLYTQNAYTALSSVRLVH